MFPIPQRFAFDFSKTIMIPPLLDTLVASRQ